MDQNEVKWDKLLKIRTSGRDDSRADTYHYPYEPTPYAVLERLSESGYIGKKNTLVDYGSGKGRVDFFLSYQNKCHSIGIEYDERIFEKAEENRKSAAAAGRVSFICTSAEEYKPAPEVDRFYFFNPFSVEILKTVIGRIREVQYEQYQSDSPDESDKEILLFFYYPSDEYVAYLMTVEELSFYDEIDCSDLFEGSNQRERILIFQYDGI